MGTPIPGEAVARDGARLVYGLSGNGPARIALTHSLAMDGSFWMPVADRLADVATVLTWDCRGHGASEKSGGPYTVELFADDLAAIFAEIGWDKAIIAGASMGGCVTLAFAGRHADKVSGVGLFDTTAWYGPDAPQQWAERAEKAVKGGLEALVAFQQTRWFSEAFRAANPDIVQESVEVFLRNDVQAYSESCRMLGAADLRSAVAGIEVPTRIAVGEEDYATPPAMAEALHQGIAGSTFKIIPGGRHLTPLEVPDVIAAELRQLIEATR
ncbi:alpha/beta fold hydrolase [Ancylobacter polymorphus]|uniref:Alpha/beta hydrolase n=1 Tax=Ancylobacter polymorphus TaxID=223390 RepID=A0A9E7A0H5_9HYPH|nr:alpha/beta fold hydrolase [Ancylobacter polymorphus]UOK73367.1 alpha/beta hydrolase [Ancylobacter polymorphus]